MSSFDLENLDLGVGAALRGKAANLLMSRYGQTIREYRAAGKEVPF